MATHLLVGNPTAQSGRARELIDLALERLAARGVAAEHLPTAPGGATVGRVRDALDARDEVEVVIALGGDGTFNEVARGVLAAARPRAVGLIPAGTANDNATSFGLEPGVAGLDRALDAVVDGHVTRLDVGVATPIEPAGPALELFDSVGWGLMADVLARRNRDRATVEGVPLLRDVYRDEAVYAGAVLNRYLASWVEPTKFTAEAVLDGVAHRWEDLTDLVVSATPIYAGSWVLDRRAEPDDGRFEVVPIRGRRDWLVKALRDLATVQLLRDHLDWLGIDGSESHQAARIELTLTRAGREGVAAQLDGEEWTRGRRFRVEVRPRALALLTPAGFRPPWKD